MPNLNDTKLIVIGSGLIAVGAFTGNPTLILLGSSLILQAAASAPKLPGLRGRTITRRDSAAAWRIIYGYQRVGGTYDLIRLTGTDNEFLNLVIVVAAHEVQAFDTMYFNGKPVPLNGIGNATAPPVNVDVLSVSSATDQIQTVSNHLLEDNYKVRFTSTGTLPGGLEADRDYFAIRVSATNFRVSKRFNGPIVDITSSGTGTRTVHPPADNRDYTGLVHAEFELGTSGQAANAELIREIDDPIVWGSNHRLRGHAYAYVRLKYDADKFPNGVPNVTFDMRGKKLWDSRSGSTVFSNNASLVESDWLQDTEYGLRVPRADMDTTLLDAAANVCDEAVTLTGGGTEARYAADGVVRTDQLHQAVLQKMNAAMAGDLTRIADKWGIYAGAWRAPTVSLNGDDFREGVDPEVLAGIGRQENFNAVKGLYVSPENDWQPADYSPVTNATYETEDGEQVFRDLSQEFVISPSQAQRLAKIVLEEARQDLTLRLPGRLLAFANQPPDVVDISHDKLGWAGKAFKLQSGQFAIEDDPEGKSKVMGYDMELRETASAVYDWNSGEETEIDFAPNSNLPNPFNTTPPASLALASGTAQLLQPGDGTIISRIKASWTAPADQFILSGGKFETQFKKSADGTWLDSPVVQGNQTETHIAPVADGLNYDVRVRSVNSISNRSDWSTVSAHTVIGKTALPADVASLTATQNGNVVVLVWPAVGDIDLLGYILKFAPQGTTDWDVATLISDRAQQTTMTTAILPPGNWTILIKAVDTTGNVSAAVTSDDVDVSENATVITDAEQAPDWPGTLTNLSKHRTGVLRLADQTSAAGNNFNVFDNYVQLAFATAVYTTPEFTLGTAGEIRVFSPLVAALAVGETGIVDAAIEVRIDAGDGEGFGAWRALPGVLITLVKKVQFRFTLTNASGLARVTGFGATLDEPVKKQTGKAVVVGASGLAIPFPTAYIGEIPNINITPHGATALIPGFENDTLTGFTAHVYDTDGVEVGGTIDWVAENA